MKLRNSTFFKYVISYVLVLSVAFVGFYAVVQFQLEREYRSVYQDETERKIQNISIVLDQDLSDILVMNYIIENNTAFIFARHTRLLCQRSPIWGEQFFMSFPLDCSLRL